MDRPIKPSLRTFDHFPEIAICPICRTNDDGISVLIPKTGTEEDGICEASPVHLVCAIPTCHETMMDGSHLIFRWSETDTGAIRTEL